MIYAIGVGSNLGERARYLSQAAAQLTDGMQMIRASPLYETTPRGGPQGQAAFLNAAWLIATDLGPHQVLHRLQGIESALGRTRAVRWGPRTIDLDLLLRDDGLLVSTAVLTLPHPLLHERSFVLEPLASIAGQWIHPCMRRTISELALAARNGTPN